MKTKEFKIGDVVVRIVSGGNSIFDINRLIKIKSILGTQFKIENSDIGSINQEHSLVSIRHATELEIKAYNRGIRNIKDIVSRGTIIQIY